MPETREPRICDRPGCGATFTPSYGQVWHRSAGYCAHTYCSMRCYRLSMGDEHPPASSYSDAAFRAQVADLKARGEPLVWPVPEFRAPTEAEMASTAA